MNFKYKHEASNIVAITRFALNPTKGLGWAMLVVATPVINFLL